MRVIVDVMGGDNAPFEMLKGALDASRACSAQIVLVGNRDGISRTAEEKGLDPGRFEIVHAASVISMEDDPLKAVKRKKDSSMVAGLSLLAAGEGDAFVSAGNTGALFAGATLIVKRACGVQRAAIGTVLPGTEPCLLLDSGANVTVSEEYLEQFAVMGSAYMRKIYGMDAPAVGLLNNGAEDSKGTPLQVAANRRLAGCGSIRYVGNVEGNKAFFGACNVLVTDGFTGNIFLKAIEGMGKRVLESVKGLVQPAGAAFAEIERKFDPAEYGGSPILGIAKPVVKAHGSSDARAFKNAVLEAVRYTESHVIDDIAGAAQRFAALRSAANGI